MFYWVHGTEDRRRLMASAQRRGIGVVVARLYYFPDDGSGNLLFDPGLFVCSPIGDGDWLVLPADAEEGGGDGIESGRSSV